MGNRNEVRSLDPSAGTVLRGVLNGVTIYFLCSVGDHTKFCGKVIKHIVATMMMDLTQREHTGFIVPRNRELWGASTTRKGGITRWAGQEFFTMVLNQIMLVKDIRPNELKAIGSLAAVPMQDNTDDAMARDVLANIENVFYGYRNDNNEADCAKKRKFETKTEVTART